MIERETLREREMEGERGEGGREAREDLAMTAFCRVSVVPHLLPSGHTHASC